MNCECGHEITADMGLMAQDRGVCSHCLAYGVRERQLMLHDCFEDTDTCIHIVSLQSSLFESNNEILKLQELLKRALPFLEDFTIRNSLLQMAEDIMEL